MVDCRYSQMKGREENERETLTSLKSVLLWVYCLSYTLSPAVVLVRDEGNFIL